MPTTRPNVSAHAFLTIDGESNPVVFDLADEQMAAVFLSEIRDLIDGMVGRTDPLTVDEPPYITVAIRPMVEGFAASLPEHPGW